MCFILRRIQYVVLAESSRKDAKNQRNQRRLEEAEHNPRENPNNQKNLRSNKLWDTVSHWTQWSHSLWDHSFVVVVFFGCLEGFAQLLPTVFDRFGFSDFLDDFGIYSYYILCNPWACQAGVRRPTRISKRRRNLLNVQNPPRSVFAGCLNISKRIQTYPNVFKRI